MGSRFEISPAPGKFFNVSTALGPRPDGTIAAGTSRGTDDGGIPAWIPKSHRSQFQEPVSPERPVYSSNEVWTGFDYGGGVIRQITRPKPDGTLAEVTRFDKGNGLDDEYGTALGQDARSNIWSGGFVGVSRFEGSDSSHSTAVINGR